MIIASWNVNSLRVRLAHLAQWLETIQPDVIALQETKVVDESFPEAELKALGYHAIFSGQKSYNGVAILTKLPAQNIHKNLPGFEDESKRVIACSVGNYRIVNVYVPNGSEVGSPKFHYKMRFLEALTEYLATELKQCSKVVVVGDFNIAPTDQDVHDPKAWEGRVHVSSEERAALARILDLGLVDVYRQFEHAGSPYSWWDYRGGAYRRGHGLRIDLLLASEALARACVKCEIDQTPRGWEQPSDHAPVLVKFA